MEPLPGVPQPEKRAYHAACCLNYGEDHPKVLINGGMDKTNINVLEDMWILKVNSGKWKKVSGRFTASFTDTSITRSMQSMFGVSATRSVEIVNIRNEYRAGP